MTRYAPYCFSASNLSDFLTSRQWIVRNEEVEEKIEELFKTTKAKFDVTYNVGTMEASVTLVTNATRAATFCFTQMDGNCNGMMVNRMYNPGVTKAVGVDITTFLIKNVASFLGDNVIHTSHYESIMNEAEKYGWNIHLKAPSNRGYPENILYGHIILKPEEMHTKGFTIGSGRAPKKNVPDVVTI